jgi:hypothetical protein
MAKKTAVQWTVHEVVAALRAFRNEKYPKAKADKANTSHPFTLTKNEVRYFSDFLYRHHKRIAAATDEGQPSFILNALCLVGLLHIIQQVQKNRVVDKAKAKAAKAAKKAKRG